MVESFDPQYLRQQIAAAEDVPALASLLADFTDGGIALVAEVAENFVATESSGAREFGAALLVAVEGERARRRLDAMRERASWGVIVAEATERPTDVVGDTIAIPSWQRATGV